MKLRFMSKAFHWLHWRHLLLLGIMCGCDCGWLGIYVTRRRRRSLYTHDTNIAPPPRRPLAARTQRNPLNRPPTHRHLVTNIFWPCNHLLSIYINTSIYYIYVCMCERKVYYSQTHTSAEQQKQQRRKLLLQPACRYTTKIWRYFVKQQKSQILIKN